MFKVLSNLQSSLLSTRNFSPYTWELLREDPKVPGRQNNLEMCFFYLEHFHGIALFLGTACFLLVMVSDRYLFLQVGLTPRSEVSITKHEYKNTEVTFLTTISYNCLKLKTLQKESLHNENEGRRRKWRHVNVETISLHYYFNLVATIG